MKKLVLALAAITVLGGSSLALVRTTGAASGTQVSDCGPCDPATCPSCPTCPADPSCPYAK